MIVMNTSTMTHSMFQPVREGFRTVFARPGYRALFGFLTLALAVLLFLVPVVVVPGNTLVLQWQLFGVVDYLLLLVIAALQGLLLTMLLYRYRQRRGVSRSLPAHVGLISGLPAFLFGAKLCPMCIAALLGFLGPSAVLAALEWRAVIFTGSAALLVFAVVVTTQSISGKGSCCAASEVRRE